MLGRLPAKPDNPFWQLTIRRIRRLGDGQVFWPPILLALGFVLLAPLPPDRFEAWPGRFTRWNLLVAGQALVVALAAGVPGWRLLTDQLHEANAVALRLSRLLPLRAVGGLAVWPLLSGLRTAVLTAPLVVALSLMPGPPGPPLAGLLGVYALVAVYATWLAAAGGAALTRTRHASIDNWSDFIFNVRTLSAAFLNPAWVLVLVLLLSRRGPALADALVGISPWFHGHLPPALVALPLLLWSIRQAAGLATEIYGETRRLAACAVFSWSAAYVVAVVLVVGFGWQSRFELHGLAVWWELPA
ncbi:MAG: hypothetical protein HUU35_08230, partial [Armatimonadetes bacterium]|nr:hypothetical protein [Armatimonadota bacterium]